MNSADLRAFLADVRREIEGRGNGRIPIPDIGFGIVPDAFFAVVCDVLGKLPENHERDGKHHASVWGSYSGVRISAMTAPRPIVESETKTNGARVNGAQRRLP